MTNKLRKVSIRKSKSRIAYLEREQDPFQIIDDMIVFEASDEDLFLMGKDYVKFLEYYNPDMDDEQN